jgi:hypothetical protein
MGMIVLGLLFFGLLAWIWTGNPWAMLTGGGPLLFLGLMLGLGCFRRARPPGQGDGVQAANSCTHFWPFSRHYFGEEDNVPSTD